jgi:hypothetical protein
MWALRYILPAPSFAEWLVILRSQYILCFYTVITKTMKPGKPLLQSTRLLDQVRERIRYLHYSHSTENAYLYWARFFVRWHGLKHRATWAERKWKPF